MMVIIFWLNMMVVISGVKLNIGGSNFVTGIIRALSATGQLINKVVTMQAFSVRECMPNLL
ncbi:hypothetical protein [Pseudomonas sp. NFACC13-1]|uniref:hypothetical protein n=1 Tax=Pseudomonas sp. NFACC13-1 TaxID=1566245 RepID=UPI00115FB1ED|nr:hypothetical protein [Pseudomonas sp. NFACC13-1]